MNKASLLLSNKKYILIVGIVVLLGIVGIYNLNNSKSPTIQTVVSPAPSTEEIATPSSSQAASTSAKESSVKEFTVVGSNFKFEPPTLSVNKGDKIKLTFKNSAGRHDLFIDEFNVQSKVIGSGEETSIEFMADKSGTFEYYCSVGNHRAMGMKGILSVL